MWLSQIQRSSAGSIAASSVASQSPPRKAAPVSRSTGSGPFQTKLLIASAPTPGTGAIAGSTVQPPTTGCGANMTGASRGIAQVLRVEFK